jgi:AcrR family transcriptional regulator
MGRKKRRLSREVRRETILKEAIEVFARRGYRGATTRLLSRKMKISEALLYQHFPTKKALFLSSIEFFGKEMLTGLKEILTTTGESPEDILRKVVSRLIRLMEKRPELGAFTLAILSELDDEDVATALRSLLKEGVELISKAIVAGQKRGVIREDQDPELLSWLTISLFELISLLSRLRMIEPSFGERFSRLAIPFLSLEKEVL